MSQLIEQPLFILWVALLAEPLLPTRLTKAPTTFLSALLMMMAGRVNNGSAKHRHLAGTLLPLIIIATLCSLLYLISEIALFPALIDLFILLIAIQGQEVRKSWKQLCAPDGLHPLRKELLRPFALRETHAHSPYGTDKAALEALSQQLVSRWFGAIFWYLCGGSTFLLLYLLSTLFAKTFNAKLIIYREFGKFSTRLYRIMSYPPFILTGLTLSFYGNPVKSLKQGITSATAWHYSAAGFFLNILSYNCQSQLGGVRIYPGEQTKQRFATIGFEQPALKQENSKMAKTETPHQALCRGRIQMRHCAQLWLVLLAIYTLYRFYAQHY